MCISCREMKNKIELLRVACYEGKLSFDSTGKAPGRGAYVCRNSDCISKAFKNRMLEKCFDISLDSDEKEKLLESILQIV